MARLRSLIEGLRSLFHKSKADAGLDEELRAYLDAAVAEKIKHGMSPAEARRAARLEMGSLDAVKEEVHSVGWEHIVETFWQDLRFAMRMLRRSPGFTAIAVLTLALGIGANTAIFSVIDAILLHPLPYKAPGRLAFIMEANPDSAFGKAEPSLPDINDWRAASKTIQQFAAFKWQNYFLRGRREPELVWGLCVSPEFFSTLGVEASRGRTFSAREAKSGDRVVVISDALWRERFGSSQAVVGRSVILNDKVYTIAGIMPPHFRFPPRDVIPGMNPQIFAPLTPTPAEATHRDERVFDVVARLKTGVSVEQARAELSAIAGSLQREYPATNKGWGIDLTPVNESAVGNMRVPLLILACAVGLVLLLACANVANMVLAHNASRQQEILVRSALGASSSRIVRQVLTESLLLAAGAGMVGVVAAGWTLRLIVSAFPANIPRVGEIRIDQTVLAFSLLIAGITALLSGLLPALRASRPDVQQKFKNGTIGFPHPHSRTSGTLVIFQTAASLVLLVGAGLLIQSMRRVLANNAGFQASGVLTARLELPPNRYRTAESVESFHRRVLERVSALPGVDSAAMVMTLPLSGRSTVMYAEPEAGGGRRTAPLALVEYNAVTRGYFQTMRVPFLGGRDFSDTEGRGASAVAIVNEAMARQFWPHQNALGKYFRFGASPSLRVVGLVANEKYWSLTDRGKPEFYLPYSEASRFGATYLMRILTFLVLRSPLRPPALAAEIRDAVWKVDPDEPVAQVETMDRLVADSLARRRFATLLLGVLGGLAALLALTGLFGVMAYSVSRRTHEIGVRMALGAQRGHVHWMVVREGILITLPGIAAGIVGALAATRFLRSLLFEVSPTDAATFAGIAVAFFIVALAACYIPARRAMRVDPMVALRHE